MVYLQEINENSRLSEVREIASAATFKGYNVLKKISNEATDKRISLPNIDEQLEKDVNVSILLCFFFGFLIEI